MADDELTNFIFRSREKGRTDEQILRALLSVGWQKEKVQNAFGRAAAAKKDAENGKQEEPDLPEKAPVQVRAPPQASQQLQQVPAQKYPQPSESQFRQTQPQMQQYPRQPGAQPQQYQTQAQQYAQTTLPQQPQQYAQPPVQKKPLFSFPIFGKQGGQVQQPPPTQPPAQQYLQQPQARQPIPASQPQMQQPAQQYQQPRAQPQQTQPQTQQYAQQPTAQGYPQQVQQPQQYAPGQQPPPQYDYSQQPLQERTSILSGVNKAIRALNFSRFMVIGAIILVVAIVAGAYIFLLPKGVSLFGAGKTITPYPKTDTGAVVPPPPATGANQTPPNSSEPAANATPEEAAGNGTPPA